MSKIICDVCGTSYPETATQCPICGCVRPSDVTVVVGDTNQAEGVQPATYTYVKGGRFSKSNVRRRNTAEGTSDNEVTDATALPRREKKGRDTGLVAAICILLLAIVSVVIYISLHFFNPAQPQSSISGTTENTTTLETQTEELLLACKDILISKTSVTLTEVGGEASVSVTTDPVDTTDTLTFVSEDETVATVTADGNTAKIIAVGNGETVITVTCGDASAKCTVVCTIEQESTGETQEETLSTEQQEEEVVAGYTISHTDVTLILSEENRKSFRITLKDSQGKSVDATWKVGNGAVCEISGNKVTALSVGETNISAVYEGETYKCRVIVRP